MTARTVRTAHLRAPVPAHRRTLRDRTVVPIEALRRQALLEGRETPGGGRPPRTPGGPTPSGVLAGLRIIAPAVWAVLVALVRVLVAGALALVKWATVFSVALALLPFMFVYHLIRATPWWVFVVLALLVLL